MQKIDEEKTKYLLNLEEKSNSREYRRHGYVDNSEDIQRAYEEKKIGLIQRFPIPTTIEGVFEFMMLAVSNFDARYYAKNLKRRDLSDAWLAKIEQAYQKAQIMFGDHPMFEKIKLMYDKAMYDKETALKRERAKIKVFACIASVLLLVAGVLVIVFSAGKAIGRSANDFMGIPVHNVVEYFEGCGFENIRVVGSHEQREGYEAGEVVSVKINGSSNFTAHDKVKRKSEIEITYIVKSVAVSSNAKDLKGENYNDVVALLKSMGFTSIHVVEKKDVTLGWINSAGDVKSVSIDGDESFEIGDTFMSDATVVVVYHGEK